MCMMFGCCGPPPHATIKAYNNTTPFALDWYDDRDGGDGGIRESAVIGWDDSSRSFSGILSPGDGSEVTGSTNEAMLLERYPATGVHYNSSTSSPLSAVDVNGAVGTLIAAPNAAPHSNVWYWQRVAGAANTRNQRLQAFNTSLVQQCTLIAPIATSVATGTNTWMSLGVKSSTAVMGYGMRREGGIGTGAIVAREFNSSGSTVATLLRSGLTLTGGRTMTLMQTLVNRSDLSDFMLVYGTESESGALYRRLWRCSKASMAESVAGTAVSATTTYLPLSYQWVSGFQGRAEYGLSSRIGSAKAILHLNDGTGTFEHQQQDGATIVCVDVSSASESWTKNDKTRYFVALDSTQVYTLDPTAGELSAVNLSTGSEAWTLDLSDDTKLGTGTGQVYGAVLSSGNIAVWRNAGVTIVTTAGSEVATVDVGPCYSIVEKSSRWIIVGAKRTTSS